MNRLRAALASFYESGPNGWVYPGGLTALHFSAELAALCGSTVADAWLTKHSGQSISLIGISLGSFLSYHGWKYHSDNTTAAAVANLPVPSPVAPHVGGEGAA